MLWKRPILRSNEIETVAEADHEARAAYERGRRDERKARKRHPVMMTLTVAAAMVGGVVLALAAKEGSFGRSGELVDHGLAVAADRAEPVVLNAADDAGAALKDAGASLKSKTTPDAES
ncbi:MAG: hypothetical protein V4597_21035 [Pseudomonadota bacterium]